MWNDGDVVVIRALGGAGSGNFGHSGRPGQIGGSSSEGGSSDSVEKQYPRAREGKTILEDKEGLNTLEQYLGTDGKLTKERRVLHDRIVAEALKGKISVDEPHVYLMGGGPASGKSVLTTEINLPANHVLVDPDTVRTKFPEWEQELKAAEREGRTPHALLAAYTHEEASMLSKRIGAEAAKQKMHIVADGTGNSSLESITRKVEGYRANGHKVIANYVTVDTDEAVRRAEERGKQTGRYVPETYLRTVHASVSELFPKAIANGLFDEVALWDTSKSGKPVKVLSGRGKDVQIHEHELYQRFLSKARRS